MAKRHPMKPHPFGEEFENMVIHIYRKQMKTESSILRSILGDFFVDGMSPADIVSGHNAFMASEPKTYGLAYYRAFIRSRFNSTNLTTGTDNVGVNDAW